MAAWNPEANEIFLKAVELRASPERRVYLDEACHGDSELRAQVDSLLQASERAGSFLESPVAAPAATVEPPGWTQGPGTVIGPYKLLEQIGEGGFGVVFMAEQLQPVRRKVAVKLIKPGMDTRQVVARFEAERQALAIMDHPNIAKVLDGGTTGVGVSASAGSLACDSRNQAEERLKAGLQLGRPYFVMELVKGVPITDYCDMNHRTPRERLELFVSVCEAVQHAHQKGIIHRDLKPSNVLVSMHDATPVVKIIDFGVAKALGQQLTEKTLFTGFAQLIGTPLYMSPEQAGQSGLDVDTRSDIYSLGVLLYELLTGTTPFDKERMRTAAYDELRRIIREEEPPRPSQRISTLGRAATTTGTARSAHHTGAAGAKNAPGAQGVDGAQHAPHVSAAPGSLYDLRTIAAQRSSDPRRLSQLCRGELDWIVMKALEKDRNRRYETASAFAADVRRHLHDEPVLACPPSAWYRLRKIVRRHKRPVLAASLVVLALVGGIIGTTWGLIRATDAQADAVNEALQKEHALADKQAALAAAQQSERDAKERLFLARLAQARASRGSGRTGQRLDSWKAVAEAAHIAHDLQLDEPLVQELRDEATACLALPDFRLVKEWEGYPLGTDGSVAFDANLERYARSDNQGNVSVRSVDDDRELARLPGPGQTALLTFSPDGRLLAATYGHGLPAQTPNFRVWDWQRELAVLQTSSLVSWCSRAFSRDGAYLALARDQGMVSLVEVATWKEVKSLPASSMPKHLAFDPTGARLAVACDNGDVQVWDLAHEKMLRKLSHPSSVLYAAWNSEGTLVATACQDGRVFVWNADTGGRHTELSGHLATANGVDFGPGGDLLLSWGWDSTGRLWDPWTGRQLVTLPGAMSPFSRDGSRLPSRHGAKLRLWELVAAPEYRALPSISTSPNTHYSAGGISPDGRWLALAGGDGVRLWDLACNKEAAYLRVGKTEQAVFHPAGAQLLVSGAAGLHSWPFRLGSDVLRIGPPHKLAVPEGLEQLSLDRAGNILAATNWILNLARPAVPPKRFDHLLNVFVATSPNGRWVASGTWNGHGVKLWDGETGQWERDLLPQVRNATVAFSPDGRWLVTGTESEFSLWDVDSWQAVRRWPRERGDDHVGIMAFSCDGGVLALGKGQGLVQLVDPATGRTFANLEAPSAGALWWLGFTPDGSQLVSVIRQPRAVYVWNLRRIRAHLQNLQLDWDLPPYARPRDDKSTDSIRIEVDLGTLAHAGDSTVHNNRALEHVQARDWANAIAEFADAIRLNPENARAQNNFAWLLATCAVAELRDATRALQHAQRAVELSPYDAVAWNTLGVVRYRAREWPAAIEALRRSDELEPGQYVGFNAFFLAMAHWQLGEQAEARRCYDRAVEWMEKNKPDDDELRRFGAEAADLFNQPSGVKDEN